MNISQHLKDSLLARGENGASIATSTHDIAVTRDFSSLFDQMATQETNYTFPQKDVEEVESISSTEFGMMTAQQDKLSRMKLEIRELAQEGYSWDEFESLQERVNEQERWERLLEFVDKRISNDFNLKEGDLSTTDFEKLMEQLFSSLETDYDFASMSQNGYDTVADLLADSGVSIPDVAVGELAPLNRLWEMYRQAQDIPSESSYTVISRTGYNLQENTGYNPQVTTGYNPHVTTGYDALANTGYNALQNQLWKELEADTTYSIPAFSSSTDTFDFLEEITSHLEQSQTQLGKFVELHTKLMESGQLFMM